MGLVSETLAAAEAERLENVLREAVNEPVAVINFCRKHVWPLYLSAIGDSWNMRKISEALRSIYAP